MLTTSPTSEGSLANFDDEFDELWHIAYRVAYRVLGVREDAEDVAQDALVRVGLKWRSVQEYAAPFTARVAGAARDRRVAPASAIAVESPRPRARPGVHPESIGVDDRDELVRALRALSERQRQVVILRYLADFDERATARAAGLLGGHREDACVPGSGRPAIWPGSRAGGRLMFEHLDDPTRRRRDRPGGVP